MKKQRTWFIFIFVSFFVLGCNTEPKKPVKLSQPTIGKCKVKSPYSVYLSWSAVSGADFYAIYYYDFTENNGKRYFAENTTSTSITYDNLAPNTNYGFTVIAKANSSEYEDSAPADIREVTTPLD